MPMNRRSPSRHRYRVYRNALRPGSAAPGGGDPVVDCESTPGASRCRDTTTLVRDFWRMLGRHRRAVFTSLALLTIAVVLGLAPLYVPKLIIDSVLGDVPLPGWIAPLLPEDPGTMLLALVGVFFGLFAASELIKLWARWHAARVNQRVRADVRRATFEHACQLPLHRVQALKMGGIASILRDDAGAIGELVTRGLFHPWSAVVQLIGSLAILVWLDWRLLLAGLMILPAAWLTHHTWRRIIRPLWKDVRQTRRDVDSQATETFGGIRIVRAFGRRRAESAAFTRSLHMMVRQELHVWWWMRGVETLWMIAAPAGTALLLLVGGWRVLSDRAAVAAGQLLPSEAFTVGGLIAFLSYLAALIRPATTLAASATQTQNALAGLDRTLDLLAESRETRPGRAVPRRVRGHIRLEGVSYRYPASDVPALDGVDLDAPAGSITALVGASGSGKSTLCNLIGRFFEPSEGRILLDGVDVREIDLEGYRRLLGIVEQDVFLLDGSIAENIAYSRRDVPTGRIEEAARFANAHRFITQMPRGYDTNIGERGVKLSGGQRQRLAIARAILADPRILILDEATSALDSESERLIQASLAELMVDRTSFVIAHRLSTIVHADQILVMDRGRIVGQGTHDQLMATAPTYQRMVELQWLDHRGSPESAPAAAGAGARR